MKRHVVTVASLILLFSAVVPLCGSERVAQSATRSTFTDFVTRHGDTLREGDREFRFISTNMPDVLQIITNKRFESDTRLRLPNEYELRDAVATVKQMHGRVMRTFVITVTDGSDPHYMVRTAGEDVAFNEDAMRVLDKLLQICNEEGVRVAIPLVNYHEGVRGSVATYGEDFFTVGSDANLRFKRMVARLLNRTNTFTGVRYKDDKAIMGWESGNEIVIGQQPERAEWLHDLAAFVKRAAPHQLFIDGRNKPDDVYAFSDGAMTHDYDEFLDDENIDVVSYHTYVGFTGPVTDSSLPEELRVPSAGDIGATNTLRIMRELTRGRMPLVVGEIAMYMEPSTLERFLDELIAGGTSGANWWATRFHNRDGGFYKHSDNGSQHEDLNWPGFPGTRDYLPEIDEEIAIQSTLRSKAWTIMGHSGEPPALPAPATPRLLPIPDVGHISWQGSTGAQSYAVQRSESKHGPWSTVGTVHDNLATYSSLFHDAEARRGQSYYYRVLAQNSGGVSAPSNLSSRVVVDRQWVVDDLFDFSKTYSREPNAGLLKSYAQTPFQEDIGVLRSRNQTSTSVEYATAGTLTKAAVYAHNGPGNVSLYGSRDGESYVELPTTSTTYQGATRTRHSYRGVSDYRFLKVELTGSAVVGRVEIEYEPDGRPAPDPEPIPPYRDPNLVMEAELFHYDEDDASASDVVTNNQGVVKVNQTGGSSSAASNVRYSIVDFLQEDDYAVFVAMVDAGTYEVELAYDARAARGKFQTALLEPGLPPDAAGLTLGDVIDAYDPGSGTIRSVNYGKVTFTESGRYGFKFISRGTNEASVNPKIGLDVIKLRSDNTAPTVTDATYSTDMVTPITGVLPAEDANGDALNFIAVHHPAEGELEIRADGTFTYTPATGKVGTFHFRWKANDGWVNSETAQVTIDVTPPRSGDGATTVHSSGT
jgi:mannan endo-1,4-beta-mannosidase